MKIEHLVITRFGLGIFSEDWYRHRFELLEAITIPSVLGQTEGGFRWVFLVDKDAPDFVFHKLNEYAQKDNRIFYIKRSTLEEDVVPSDINDLLGIDADYVLTTRIDDDDAVAIDTYELVREKTSGLLSKGLAKGALITFEQGYELDVNKGRYSLYSHPSHSMAIHLLLPSFDKRTCYSFSHSKIANVYVEKNGWGHFVCKSGLDDASWLYVRHLHADSRLNKVKEGYKKVDGVVAKSWEDAFGINGESLLDYIKRSDLVKKINKDIFINSKFIEGMSFRKKPTAMMVREIVAKEAKKLILKSRECGLSDSENTQLDELLKEYRRLGTELF